MRRTLSIFVGIVLCAATAAQAQATRTWVSGVGNDADPCSRTAPCKTFGGAIGSTADPGEIDALDSGGFGAVTITKTMTIDGGGTLAGILASGGVTGVTINAPGKTVILRRLSIQGAGASLGLNGINVIAVGELHVEDCQIVGFSNRGINFNATNGYLFVSNTTIANNGNAAVYVSNGHATIDRLIATGNQTGVLSAGSSNVTVRASVASGGSMGFAAAYGPTAAINLEDSVSTNNDYGIVVGNGATARVSNSSIFHSNIAGLYNDGASFLISYGTNRLNANAVDGSFTSLAALR